MTILGRNFLMVKAKTGNDKHTDKCYGEALHDYL